MGAKVLLIAGEISALMCTLILLFGFASQSVECDYVNAAMCFMLVVSVLMLQSLQQTIPWKEDAQHESR